MQEKSYGFGRTLVLALPSNGPMVAVPSSMLVWEEHGGTEMSSFCRDARPKIGKLSGSIPSANDGLSAEPSISGPDEPEANPLANLSRD